MGVESFRSMIVGLDISTRLIAMVTISSKDGSIVRFDEYAIPDLKRLDRNKAERCRAVADTGFQTQMSGVVAAYVEQPMGRQVKGVAEVERVVGAVIAAIPKETCISLISPSEWKKIVGLKGNAQKDDIREFADAIYPVLQNSSQDLHDAAMIARACYMEGMSQ